MEKEEEVERNLIERKEQVEVAVEVEVEVMVVRGLKGVKGIYEGSRGERKKERERESHVECGVKGQTTGVLGYV